MNEIILETHNLTKKYKSFVAIDNANIQISKGDIYGLIGRNGAGKTTLMKLITTLANKTSGDFKLFEKKDTELTETKRRIGCLIENPAFFLNLSAVENLKYYAIQKGIVDKKQIDEAINLVGLTEAKKKKFKTYSLGMKQRLGIAFAILDNPDFIILDEPINGLDPIGISELRDLFKKLNEERNITILISSHILNELYLVANKFCIIEKGKVLKNILKSFNDIGYNLEYRLLNAAEYGVPQQRERTIFIGTKTNTKIKYPKKTHSLNTQSPLKKAISLWEAISDLPQSNDKEITNYSLPSQNEYQYKIRGQNTVIKNHIPSLHNEKAIKMMTYIPPGKSVWDIKEKIPSQYIPTSGYGNTYARLDPDEPGMTITRNFSCISSSRCIHPYLNRGLTAREAARIQSYPDDYIFLGSKTDISIQIGNSVPPLLAEKIAYTIKEMLDETKK